MIFFSISFKDYITVLKQKIIYILIVLLHYQIKLNK